MNTGTFKMITHLKILVKYAMLTLTPIPSKNDLDPVFPLTDNIELVILCSNTTENVVKEYCPGYQDLDLARALSAKNSPDLEQVPSPFQVFVFLWYKRMTWTR